MAPVKIQGRGTSVLVGLGRCVIDPNCHYGGGSMVCGPNRSLHWSKEGDLKFKRAPGRYIKRVRGSTRTHGHSRIGGNLPIGQGPGECGTSWYLLVKVMCGFKESP